MARRRDLRLWALAVVAICLLAAGGGTTGATSAPVDGGGASRPAMAVLAPAANAAVLPARLVDDVRSAASTGPLRLVAVGTLVASLLGLAALVRRLAPPTGRGRRSLGTRRHAIALRAPPLPFAA